MNRDKKSVTDATELLRKAEKKVVSQPAAFELSGSEMRLRTIIDDTPAGYFYIDQEGCFRHVNDAWLRMHGYGSPEEVIGQHYSITQVDSDLETAHQHVAYLLNGHPIPTSEFTRRCRDGSVGYHTFSAHPVVQAGEVVGLEGFIIDITERKRSEEKLRKSEERYRLLFNSGNDAVFVHEGPVNGLPGKFIEVNEVACQRLGYTREEFMKMSPPDIDAPETVLNVPAIMEKLLAEKSVVWEGGHVSKDGLKIPVEISNQLFELEGRPAILSVARDITERSQIEEVQAFLAQTSTGTAHAPFFEGLARYLAKSLGMDFVCIDRLEGDGLTARTVAVWCDGKFEDNVTYALKDTPCGDVVGKTVCCFPAQVCQFYPRDQVLRDLRAESYVGVTLWSYTGQPIGLIAVIGRRPMTNRPLAEAMLKLVSVRAAGELERLDAEAALRESEKTHRALVEGLPDIVKRLDRDGRHLFVSNNVSDVVDFQAAHYIGKTHRELGFPEEECRFWEEAIQGVFDSGASFETEITCAGKEGPVIHNVRLVAERDARGKVRSVLSIRRDITAHRLAEENYRTLFREMLDGFALHEILFDARGKPADYRFLAVNPAFERQTGLKAEELLGRTVLEVLPGTERHWIETYGKVALTGEPVFFENYHAGMKKHFEVTAFRPAPNQFACIFADITGRKQAEEEKAKLEAQLQQAQKMESVGRLAGGVAHDFNNMLGVIIGHAELAMMRANLSPPLLTDLEAIHKAAERSANLTRQLLAFARKQTIASKVLDLNEAVAGMLNMLKRLIGEDIHLNWQPGADLWPVEIDPSQIDQILANLCVNARDAISDVGKLTIETGNSTVDNDYCVQHAGFVPGEYVRLAVSDEGCGMDRETLSHLFEPFFTTKEVGKGTGLGLATVYGIVKQNNGFINVYSEPDQGSTFKIYLPRHVAKAGPARTEGASRPVLRGQETILLVEDEPAILELTTELLEMQGYTVLAASTPGEAIRLAREHSGETHLLVTDVIMPGMNGRDLAKNLLSLYPHLKRLFISGYTADVIAHHGVLDEGVHFIQKPFSMQALATKVREVLDYEK